MVFSPMSLGVSFLRECGETIVHIIRACSLFMRALGESLVMKFKGVRTPEQKVLHLLISREFEKILSIK